MTELPLRDIWLLDDGLILGGGQLFALRLARWAGRPVRLVCPAGSELAQRARAQGTEVVDATFPDPHPSQALALAQAARRLRSALGRPRSATDVVVSGSVRCSLVAGVALCMRRDAPPLVHLLHERDSAERASVRLALRRSQRVVAIGSVAAAAYRSALPRARVDQAANFLAPDTLAELASGRCPPGSSGPPRLGVLGRLIPEKGIAVLVDELASVPSAWATLQIAGAPQDAAEVQRIKERIEVHALGERVSLLDPVADVGGFLSGIDRLVVPSVGAEAQPTVILEALAAGRDVIAREQIVSEDFAGLPVHPYRDATGLAAALAGSVAAPVSPNEIARRFGPAQAVAAIDRAAS